MKPSQLSADNGEFIAQVKELEERLFPDELHETDQKRMKSDDYSWLYRPSHHVKTGLITEFDVAELAQGKRLLSVGAHPAYLERVLCELGVPAEHMLLADSDPSFLDEDIGIEKTLFDMLGDWPEIGTFDLIIFPESLCIALADTIEKTGIQTGGTHATDALEATLLSKVLRQALDRLEPEGEIRSNGPQSHPNVVKAARAELEEEGYKHELDYKRYFLSVRNSET